MGLGSDIGKLYDELSEVSKKQSEKVKPISVHWHHCPECYDSYQCNMECTIESEEDDGRQFGAHCKCFSCEPLVGYDSRGNKVEEFSQDWWDRYNGIKRCG